jgi:hypothetical protein
MAVHSAVALEATTWSSLADHLPPVRTDKIARPKRCWIVEWNAQPPREPPRFDPRDSGGGSSDEVSRGGSAQALLDDLAAG